MKLFALNLLFVVCFAGLVAPRLCAQLAPPESRPVIGARMPALSPDGKQIAFVYRGDIWLAPVKGGRATPLTQHVELDAYPLFSPDGHWIAFASRRNGNWDVFAVPVEGGPARQLTWHAESELPQGWSPDGRRLLFASKRDTPNQALFALDVTTLRPEVLGEDYVRLYSPNYSPDGKLVVYGRNGFHWTRPRYHGSAAAQLWLLDVASGTRRALTTNDFQHLWPRFLPDGQSVVTVTVGEATPSTMRLDETPPRWVDNPNRTPNLWVFDLRGRGKPLTTFTGGAVRHPTVAWKSGDIAFEYGPDLWLLRAGRRKPERLQFFANLDDKQNPRRREKLTSGVTEAEPSPDGKTFAFGLRGDIWTVLIEKPKGVAGRSAEFARRLTDWVGDDSDFSWAPDGKKLYFTSDREANVRLYELELETLKVRPLWKRDENVSGLRLSPNGRQAGFWVAGREGGLFVMDLASGDIRRLIKVPGPQWRGIGGGDFAWSPDHRWIAYSHRGESRAWNLWVVPAEGGEAVNVTRLYAQHGQPAWSPDGKYLFFQSNRDGDGLYVLPLLAEAARTIDTDLKFEKPGTNVTVKIDFANTSRRIRKVCAQSPQADLTVTAEGAIVFLSDNDIWSVGYDGKEPKRLTTGGGKSALRVSKDGKKGFYIQNGELYTINLEAKSAEKVAFTADSERDVRAERRAAFMQFWHAYSRGFYDPSFHGRDWFATRERYEPLLDAVETGEEFAALLQMMVGELDCSHSEVTPAGGPPAPVTPHLGFTFDYGYDGPGLRVAKVPAGAPGSFDKTRLRKGEYVLAINGQDVTLDERLYQLINDKQDREFEFLVSTNADKAGARKVRYKVLSPEEWNQLNYRNRVERLRQYVEERSGGRLGYLHLAAMGQGNQNQFEREAYEYMVGKEAMVIDVRFNTGGNIADTLIQWLDRKPHGYVRPRDARPEATPFHSWDKRLVVLIGETSFSNAEIFPAAIRARGLGRLVGQSTPGYVIWTDGLRLVDGTNARMPQSGAFRLDGTNLENNGERPDISVALSPEDWLADRDPQLDKAIEVMMAETAGRAGQRQGE